MTHGIPRPHALLKDQSCKTHPTLHTTSNTYLTPSSSSPPCSSCLSFNMGEGDVRDVQLSIRGLPILGAQEPTQPSKNAAQSPPTTPLPSVFKHWKWWLTVALAISFALTGQTAGNLLGRFYFNEGGNSKWMATLVQSAGFPVLLLPFLLFTLPRSAAITNTTTTTTTKPRTPFTKIITIYVTLGLIIAGDNLMYTYGLLFLPLSTFSLICASQLAFNSVFSYFLNSQKFTHLIFNSVVLLTFSAALLGVRSDSTTVSNENYPLGFILTLAASATFSLILSLFQLTFQKVLKRETFMVVLELQMCTNFVATLVCVVGLFASGEWRGLKGEMDGYGKGKLSYVMTLVWTAISWQTCALGVVGLIFVVSSLFSNVISTVGLPIVPIFSVIFFHDKMDGVKVVSMLIAIWGFLSYIYQHYLDDMGDKKLKNTDEEVGFAAS